VWVATTPAPLANKEGDVMVPNLKLASYSRIDRNGGTPPTGTALDLAGSAHPNGESGSYIRKQPTRHRRSHLILTAAVHCYTRQRGVFRDTGACEHDIEPALMGIRPSSPALCLAKGHYPSGQSEITPWRKATRAD